jgi:hypothetical protein
LRCWCGFPAAISPAVAAAADEETANRIVKLRGPGSRVQSRSILPGRVSESCEVLDRTGDAIDAGHGLNCLYKADVPAVSSTRSSLPPPGRLTAAAGVSPPTWAAARAAVLWAAFGYSPSPHFGLLLLGFRRFAVVAIFRRLSRRRPRRFAIVAVLHHGHSPEGGFVGSSPSNSSKAVHTGGLHKRNLRTCGGRSGVPVNSALANSMTVRTRAILPPRGGGMGAPGVLGLLCAGALGFSELGQLND